MTPHERRAAKRAYDRARYLRQREQRTIKYRQRYQSNPEFATHKRAYLRGYYAGLKRVAKLWNVPVTSLVRPEHTQQGVAEHVVCRP